MAQKVDSFKTIFFKCDLTADLGLGWPFLVKQYSKNSFKSRPKAYKI